MHSEPVKGLDAFAREDQAVRGAGGAKDIPSQEKTESVQANIPSCILGKGCDRCGYCY